MRNIVLAATGLLLSTNVAMATCTWTNLMNGSVADASQVMGNFACVAPLANPTFSTNVGIGTAPDFGTDLFVSGEPGYSGGSSAGIAMKAYWTSGSLTGVGNTYDSYFIMSGSSTVNLINGYEANGGSLSGGTLSNYNAFYSPQWPTGGTVTNNYGFRAKGFAGPNNYGVYVDLAQSFFGGNVGIGTTNPTNSLSVENDQNALTLVTITNTSTGNNATSGVVFGSSITGYPYLAGAIATRSSGVIPSGLIYPSQVELDAWAGATNGLLIAALAAAPIKFATNSTEVMRITSSGNVGIGTATPAQSLEVNGQVQIDSLASASSINLCINVSNVIASCSSSIRYKENVASARFGLKEVEAMRPVTFKWKGRHENDFGFIAEEMAKVDQRFVTYEAGRIEGVKYPQLTAVLVNAIKELKAANDGQAAEIQELKIATDRQVGALREMRFQIGALQRKLSIRTAAR